MKVGVIMISRRRRLVRKIRSRRKQTKRLLHGVTESWQCDRTRTTACAIVPIPLLNRFLGAEAVAVDLVNSHLVADYSLGGIQ